MRRLFYIEAENADGVSQSLFVIHYTGREAIQCWRDYYDLTDDDLTLETARMMECAPITGFGQSVGPVKWDLVDIDDWMEQ